MATAPADLAADFRRDGVAGPFRAVDAATADGLRQRYCRAAGVDPLACGPATRPLSAWHLRHRWAYDLATRPGILDRVEAVLGPDIVLWAWFSWYKEPRTGRPIPWHQDASYWPIEPKRNVTAWVALAASTPDNGCLRVIPGSQGALLPQVAVADPASWFAQGADPAAIDAARARDLALAPGEFVLFDEGVLHGSEPNRSDRPRIALSLRYTSPDVCLHGDRWGDDRVRALLVRGVDRFHRNDRWLATPPADGEDA